MSPPKEDGVPEPPSGEASPQGPPAAKSVGSGGLAHGPLAVVGLLGGVAAVVLSRLGTPWWDVVALVSLLVLMPALSVVQVKALRDVQVERMPAYVSSIISLLLLGGGAWMVGAWGIRTSADVGLVMLSWPRFLLWTGVIFLGGLAATLAFRWLGTTLGLRETALLRTLMPRTARERGAFGLLSLAAGFGEELAYRGYVIGVLSVMVGPLTAAVVSSLVFGVLHIYQGVLGVVRTSVLGGLLAWGFLAGGSLLPAMAAHALLDVVLGIVLGERMMVPDASDGVPTSA